MPFDGNGNWTSNFSAVADRDANIKILASRFDGILLADIAQSFENCLTKDMQVKPQQAFNANNYRVINVSDPIDVTDAVNLQTLDGKDALCVHKAGTETITGDKTFSGSNTFSNTITGSISGNAGTVTNGVYTTGNQTIGGTKTFSSTISGSINGNAATVTNGVYTTGNQTVGGNKKFSGTTTFSGSVTATGNITSSGTNSFSGTNNFTSTVSLGSSATATTKGVSDDSTSVATTGYVKDCVPKSVGSSSKPVYTDSDGVITACDFGIPDYTNRVEFTTTDYTPTKNGIIRVRAQGSSPMAQISIGNFTIARSESTDSSSGIEAVWAIVRAGETYTVSYNGSTSHAFFFVPFK